MRYSNQPYGFQALHSRSRLDGGRPDTPRNLQSGWCVRACVALVFCAACATGARAQTLVTLYNFCSHSDCADGATPSAALIQATNGSLYGSTLSGGTANDGTLFKMTTSGELSLLYDFCSAANCTDGSLPNSPLVLGPDGNFYGTTTQGGPSGGGAFFDITLSGQFTAIGSGFGGTNAPGDPLGLFAGTDGNFYGATALGGYRGRGTVFGLTPSGSLKTLYDFCKTSPCASGGAFPEGGLVEGMDGNYYGTTTQGGNGADCQDAKTGCGTIFRITTGGTLTVLYDFCSQTGCSDGFDPVAPMIQGVDGNFYGTTAQGGIDNCSSLGSGDDGCGTVFKIGSGGYQVLYSFCPESGCTDGAIPQAGLVQASDGNFYGTTALGGAGGEGTIFKISPGGTFTLLYTFCSLSDCADGGEPGAALIQDTNGKLYGTTTVGGSNTACPSGCGTAFSLSAGLGEFVLPEPNSGAVGAAVNILGTALEGATSVTFNGTPATFTVSSSSLITTTVPAGATTGEVDVVTPHGTIQSTVRFHVLQ
jgi:uncharacterized repeat protein (TIGR03803 family)